MSISATIARDNGSGIFLSAGDNAKASDELARIEFPALVLAVARKLPGDLEANMRVLSKSLSATLEPIFTQYSKSATPIIKTDTPFLAWADEVEKYHASLI